ncbi:MAG TPA: 23S rRNA pseudouridine synthase F, partial [Lachnospiraceae bacterium]|nr:23S rRNA pseudouridine synthase F [Lachnospiraceae bacterium]
TQGLNRQIRRMWQTVGYTVTKLKRVRVINIELKSLKPGEYRIIEGEELQMMYQQVGM